LPANGIRSANEIEEAVFVKPEQINVPEDAHIEPLGQVHEVVNANVIIKANTDGSYKVLDEGSVVLLQDRFVLGAVFETFGRVEQPMYTIRFESAQNIDREKILPGVQVFYAPDFSKFVLRQALVGVKGSDASNMHDEEVAEEVLFSCYVKC
jgi:H/ACA ribonucleoprotein complex non-core subunit NAF1